MSGDTWRGAIPMYAELRANDPVHWVEEGHYWVVSRFVDVFNAARDTARFSSAQGLTFERGEREQLGIDIAPMVMMDPPEHTGFRRLVASGFTPRKVAELEPAIREFVTERLDRLAEHGGGDIVAELFKPLPSFVVAHYLGVPAEDRARFDDWTEAIVSANAAGSALDAEHAVAGLVTYFSDLIDRRRSELVLARSAVGGPAPSASATSPRGSEPGAAGDARTGLGAPGLGGTWADDSGLDGSGLGAAGPGAAGLGAAGLGAAGPGAAGPDDTVSKLVLAEARGEAVDVLAILGFAFTMVTGGNDTVTGLLGGATELLAEHPEQRRRLVEQPDLIGSAVEELLRLTSPVQGLARTTTEAVEIGGVSIPKDAKVLLLYASANRDHDEFGPDADELDVERAITRQMSFSYGAHHCLGAAAARLQGRVALEELLARWPGYEVVPDSAEFAPGPFVKRHARLDIRVGQ